MARWLLWWVFCDAQQEVGDACAAVAVCEIPAQDDQVQSLVHAFDMVRFELDPIVWAVAVEPVRGIQALDHDAFHAVEGW